MLFKLYIFNQLKAFLRGVVLVPRLSKVAEPCLEEMTALPLHFKTIERSGSERKAKCEGHNLNLSRGEGREHRRWGLLVVKC